LLNLHSTVGVLVMVTVRVGVRDIGITIAGVVYLRLGITIAIALSLLLSKILSVLIRDVNFREFYFSIREFQFSSLVEYSKLTRHTA